MKALLILLAASLVTGCHVINQMMPSQRRAAERAQTLQELNLKVMRFSDEYAGRVREVMVQFQATAGTPEERLAAQNWKLQQAESAYTIASGPNPVSNALDMVVLATLSRLVLDDLWITQQYGARAVLAHETHQSLEQGAWGLVEDVLTPSQRDQLRGLINEWRKHNPSVRAVAYVHFQDFAKSLGSPRAGEEHSPGNLFSILGLDPFAQLDPAIREVTQTRELAERAIFYMQRAPRLLDMEVERVTYQFAVMPETKALLADMNRAALVGVAANRVASTYPDVLARERQALVSQLMAELTARQRTLAALSQDVRLTLQSATDTANALHGTLDTVDRIAARFPRKPEPADQAAAASKPLDISEYTDMIRELAVTTRTINDLAQSADRAAPVVQAALVDVTAASTGILNHAFRLLLALIALTVLMVVLGALLYRVVAARLAR